MGGVGLERAGGLVGRGAPDPGGQGQNPPSILLSSAQFFPENTALIHFLSHPVHAQTQAFDWLFAALPKNMRVIYGSPEGLDDYLPSLQKKPPALLVLFQLDYLAFWCRHFCPVVIFPMYDQSRQSPDPALASLREVGWISLSRDLHQRLCALGLDSSYIQYAPDPKNFRPVRWGSKSQGYFWERIPRDLDGKAASDLGLQLGGVKVKVRHLSDARLRQGGEGSFWKSRQDYLRNLGKFQVYFAPRKYEGIGMTFLEAMAMGMCVVAENAPTANEYITSGQNGILYGGWADKLYAPPPRSIQELRRMGMGARETMRRIHQAWLRERGQISIVLSRTCKRFRRLSTAPHPDLLRASLEFDRQPERLWSLVCSAQGEIWRSQERKDRNKTSRYWSGILRQGWRHPRRTLLGIVNHLLGNSSGLRQAIF